MRQDFLTLLFNGVTKQRQKLFWEKVALRTRYATVVLEDLYQPQNASAVLRTCDCFGIQDVHIIENDHKWETSPSVERGSSQWLNLFRYKNQPDNSKACLQHLQSKNYKIVATSPHAKMGIAELPVEEPLAFAFGCERYGLSPTFMETADYTVKIPMYGFTESFNISVAAAICLNTFREMLHKSNVNWQLSEDEKTEIMIQWCSHTVRHYDKYVLTFQQMQKQQ